MKRLIGVALLAAMLAGMGGCVYYPPHNSVRYSDGAYYDNGSVAYDQGQVYDDGYGGGYYYGAPAYGYGYGYYGPGCCFWPWIGFGLFGSYSFHGGHFHHGESHGGNHDGGHQGGSHDGSHGHH